MNRGGQRGRSDRLAPERAAFSAGHRRIAGVDEAGRGPLAGPVVAAAVILPLTWINDGVPAGFYDLNDSKQLSATQRERFFTLLAETPEVEFAVAQIDSETIDTLNILRASHRAMNLALQQLSSRPDHALVDGLPVPTLCVEHSALVKGDARSYSIAAASVLAKVTRDRIMTAAEEKWPGYGFAKHKGYPTKDHFEALARLGPCPLHRRSFSPVRQLELFFG